MGVDEGNLQVVAVQYRPASKKHINNEAKLRFS